MNILTFFGKWVFLLCVCLSAPCLYSVSSCCFVQDLTFLFFFLLAASLLFFPSFFFYMLFLSDLGGGRYCTEASSPSAISTPSLKDTELSCLSFYSHCVSRVCSPHTPNKSNTPSELLCIALWLLAYFGERSALTPIYLPSNSLT